MSRKYLTTSASSLPRPIRVAAERAAALEYYKPLLVLLAVGFALRVLTMALYFPTALQWIDAVRFSRIGQWHGFFSDYYMPAGYAVFLKVTHFLSADIAFTILVQHLLGLAVGVLVFAAVRRAGASRRLALIPAAVPILSGDQMYLEHILMNDFFFAFTMAVALCIAVYALLPVPNWRLIALAGFVGAASGLVRQGGFVVPVALAVCSLFVAAQSPRHRLGRAAAALLPALALVGIYIAVADLSGGYTGLTDMGGWNLYARAAPFADCHSFTPPKGTSVLCEATPHSQRNGPFWYAWEPQSQGQRVLGLATPANERLPQEFALTAVEHQPLAYLRAVAKDILRYAEPDVGTTRAWSGQGPDTVSFEQGVIDPGTARSLENVMGSYWTDLKPHLTGVQLLDWYQGATRMRGLLWWLLALLAVTGITLGRGPQRIAALLFGLTAFGVYVVPTMTVSWDWRYGIPPQFELAVAATLGALAIRARGRERAHR